MAKPVIVPLMNEMPPGLNTASPPSDLKPNETPDSYGFDLTVDGKVKKGTLPTGTSRVQKIPGSTWGTSTAYIVDDVVVNNSLAYICLVAHTPGTFSADLAAGKWVLITAFWHHRRIWRLNTTTLEYGSLSYDDHFYAPAQGLNKITLTEDSNSLLVAVPLEPDSIFVGKSTGGYMIRNLSDTRGFFQVSDLIQEMAVPAVGQAIELGNVVYVTNADGLQGYESFKTKEISRVIRPSRSNLASATLTADYERGWLILGTTYVYDTTVDKWFNYSGSSFRLTSRTMRNPDHSPFSPLSLRFAIEHGDSTQGYLTYQTKYEDDPWDTGINVTLPYKAEYFSVVSESIREARACHRFAIRVTALSSTKYIREIQIEAEDFAVDDYSS